MPAPLYRNDKNHRLTVLLSLALAAAVVFFTAGFPVLAEYVYARGIARLLSGLLSSLTNWAAVSFYELTAVFLILGVPALFIAVIALLLKKSFARVKLYLYRLACAALIALTVFGLVYAPLYNRPPVTETLAISDAAVTDEQVYHAAEYYVDRLNEASGKLSRDGQGAVLPPHSFSETAELINSGFIGLGDGYFAEYDVRPKQVALSVPMSYLGITGIYFPFTAEANVNVNIPSYELPFTMAHEIAHARGVSRENEANIVAFAVCLYSSDAYLNYSALMSAAARTLNSLPDDDFAELRSRLKPEIIAEYALAARHYERYDGVIDKISSFFNNLFLKANGIVSGTASYGETVRALVSIYEKLSN
ncbi:MAG: DUF3810 domain-containing protein [Christensenellales bacterium]